MTMITIDTTDEQIARDEEQQDFDEATNEDMSAKDKYLASLLIRYFGCEG